MVGSDKLLAQTKSADKVFLWKSYVSYKVLINVKNWQSIKTCRRWIKLKVKFKVYDTEYLQSVLGLIVGIITTIITRIAPSFQVFIFVVWFSGAFCLLVDNMIKKQEF